MARYNTYNTQSTISGASSINPQSGTFTELTGAAPYTISLPAASAYPGFIQTFYNNTSGPAGIVTLSAAGGNFSGPGGSGTSSFSLAASASITLNSDGVNYIIVDSAGGPIVASTLTVNGTTSISPASNQSVSVTTTGSGTITLTSGTAGSIDNVNIGATTAGTGRFSSLGVTAGINSVAIGNTTPSTGAFTTLAASGLVSLSVSTGTHTISSNTASTTVSSGALTITGGLGVGGQITTASLVETSSKVLKKSIKPLDNALDSVLKLRGVSYDRKDGSTKNEVGLIAEEVFKITPWLVTLDEKGKPYGVHYTKLSAYLIESIKELKKEIEALKKGQK
jgi:hypothetical protein